MSSAGIIEEHSQGNACWHVHLRKTNQQLLLQMTLVCFSCWYTMLIPPITLLNYRSCIWRPPERSSPFKLKNNLDHSLVWSLLFIHAISGCDTTSRPYGVGKVTALSKYAALSRAADVFLSAKAEIAKIGEKAVPVIRGCTSSLTLNGACVARLLQRVATSTQYVYPEKLHHTSDTAALHSHQAYHQVQAWYGRYIPAAPQTLLKVIRCNCTGQCDRKSCTCRKHGLKCAPASVQCKGEPAWMWHQ